MGYQLRLHSEIREWLTDLRDSEPELGRLVGEAVVALLDAGETLGPPLAVPLESVLRPPDDPCRTASFSDHSENGQSAQQQQILGERRERAEHAERPIRIRLG